MPLTLLTLWVFSGNHPHRQTPILTCFVADQPSGSAFTASVHSWLTSGSTTTPHPLLSGHKRPCYEARTYVDGLFVTYAFTSMLHFSHSAGLSCIAVAR